MTAFERFAAGEAMLQVGGCAEAPRVPVRIRGRAGVRGGESVLASEFMAPPREGFPLLARPAPGSATRDRKQWAAGARQLLDRRLEEVGAVLLRGLLLRTPAEFSELFGALGYATVAYRGHSTRAEVAPGVFTANTRNPGQSIDLHNDMSQEPVMPAQLFLFCAAAPPAGAGGATPIARGADWKDALGAELFERFARRGLERRTNSPTRGDLHKTGRPWQERYRTEDPAVAEASCREQGDVVEWLPDGSLSTRRHVDAVREHRGETLWCCTPQSTDTASSYEIRYADGEPIEAGVLERLRALQWKLSVAFEWQAGDVLCLDNIACQHGRLPLAAGAQRQILVSLATPQPGTCRMPVAGSGG